tara:strand:+ start:6367 stop:7182 length:816 start_codon:yes stop_codon:yes gene_type:complete
MAVGFIKLNRTSEMMNLLTKDHAAFVLLSIISVRADRTTGEALIGDWEAMGATSRGAYRNALKRLLATSLVTTTTTSKGTIAKLTDTTVYDINQSEPSHQSDHQPSHQAPKTTTITQATNKKLKNLSLIQEVKERGVSENLITDWLKARTARRNTETALNKQLENLDYLIDKGFSAQKIFELLAEKSWLGIKTGKNPKDQYFLDELQEHQDARQQLTDTDWSYPDQHNFQDPPVDLPRISQRSESGRCQSDKTDLAAEPVTLSGEASYARS